MNEALNASALIDIRDVSVDKSLPKHERITEFIRQIKDPYHFKCGIYTVTAVYLKDGPTLEDCLRRIIA